MKERQPNSPKASFLLWFLLVVLILAVIILAHLLVKPGLPSETANKPPESLSVPSHSTPSKPVSYAGDRYYAGMPLPSTEFRYHIKILNNIGYSAGYCPERKTPAWVAYRVFKVQDYQAPPRPQKFEPDRRITDSPMSSDYIGSGYDRGHMAPNYVIAICYGARAQKETFLMTNIVPQKPKLNREVWENLERVEAKEWSNRYGSVWVMDGPVYDNDDGKLKGGEEIPHACYKILIRDESKDPKVLAFIIPQTVLGNEKPSQFLTSVDEIERETKLDFLHDLPDDKEEKVEAEKAVGMW